MATKKSLIEQLEMMVDDDIKSQETIIRLSKENKELQHKLDVIKQYIYNHALCFNGEIETDLDIEECKDLVHYIDTNSFDREVEDE